MKRHVEITAERLREMLSYDKDSGVFVWRKRVSNVAAGAIAGRIIGKAGYRYIRIDNYDYTAQRLAWLYVTGEWPKAPVQFIDESNRNLRFSNLRLTNALPNASDFDTSTRDGMNAYNRARRKAFPDIHKNWDLQRSFGLTLEDYKAKLLAQNGCCAICDRPETSMRAGKLKMMAVDHCHTTNEIRDLLCSRCNPMIGYAQDEPDILRKAADYLERHKGASQKVIPLRIVSKENT